MIAVSTVALVLNERSQVWLMRRTDKCRDEHWRWDVCAGALEEGVTVEQNMLNELNEELGLTTARPTFLGYRDVFRPGLPHTVGMDFLVRTETSAPCRMEPHKHDMDGWFDRSSLPDLLHSQVPVFLRKYADLIR